MNKRFSHSDLLTDDLEKPRHGGMLRGRLVHSDRIMKFIEAGNATLTLVSVKTGARFTYRFHRPDEASTQLHNQAFGSRPIWISVLSGPDNEAAYSFIGTIFPARSTTEIRQSARSKVGPEAPSYKTVAWFLRRVYGGKEEPGLWSTGVEVWHEGRCGRCGRKLTVPQSIESGFGPDCISKMGG